MTLAPKLTIDDGRLTWTASADEVYNRYRGVTPEPGAHTTIGGARFKVLEARQASDVRLPPGHLGLADGRVIVGTGTSALELLRVQPAGKPAMAAADWWRGLGRDPAIVAE